MKKLKEIKDRIFISNNYTWITLLFLLLAIPNITGLFLLSDLNDRITMKIAYVGFALILWITPAFFLKLRTYFLVMSVFLLLSPIEIAHIILNGMPVTEGFISAIIHTNFSEAWELINTLKVIALLYILTVTGYYYITFKKIENRYLFTRTAAIGLFSLCLIGNLVLYGAMLRIAFQMDAPLPWNYATEHFAKKYRKIYPYDLITVSYRTYAVQQEMRQLQKELADFSFDATRPLIEGREIYVVVIGESARFSNFAINGYSYPTTPLLEKVEGLLSYSDVTATANLTEIALPLLLTRATPLNPSIGYKEKSIVDAFAECGFKTAWLATQSSQYRFVKRIAEEASYSYFSTTDFDASTNYDEHLLPHLEKILSEKNEKQLIVLHTLGSHFRYNFRYPEKFSFFTPALEGTSGTSVLTPSNKEILVNSYDNTIRYTDWMLSSVIERLKKENAISTFFYISDHAENLYDDGNNLILHGGGQFSKYEIHIPILLWTSEKYNMLFPEKRKELNEHTNKKISSDNFFHTLLDIAAIRYPQENTEKSFASPQFKEDSIRHVLMPDNHIVSF